MKKNRYNEVMIKKIHQSIRIIGFTTLLLSFLSLKQGDMIELEKYVNAHTSASFLKSFPNVKTILKKGTTGEVIELKKMPSGNYGIKMKVNSGPHANESYWVYYNLKTPAMKITDKNDSVIVNPEKHEASKAELTKDQLALRSIDESALIETVQKTNQVLTKKPLVDNPNSAKNCDYFDNSPIEKINETDFSESNLVEPFAEVATSPLHSNSCRSSGKGYEICKNDKGLIESFQLSNNGGNSIVSEKEYYINRNFTFEFNDRARSDMKLIISDSPDETTSHVTYSAMVFLPRKVLPSIKQVGEELIVTLPTKEIVKFNAQTKEVVGGAFTEGPMRQGPNKKASAADIQYRGYGVLIRTDKSGDLPYGDIELSNGKSAPSISTAVISKKGFKDCKIFSKEIWYTDYTKGSEIFIKPELASDSGMDSFIVKRCGFSIF